MAGSWYSFKTNVDDSYQHRINGLSSKFTSKLLLVPRPQKPAMFSSNIDTASNVTIYFSPDCNVYMSEILKEYSASPCEKPVRNDVGKICGIDDYLDLIWE